MNSETFLQAAQLGTIVVGFLGVAVTLRSHRRQMHAQMFIEFSSRFHEVLRAMPAHIWAGHGDEEAKIPARSEELTRSCMQCFHLVAALYFLHKGGYISRDLWKPWQSGIRRTMQGPLLQREWFALEGAFNHTPEFSRYMHGMIKGNAHGTRMHATHVT